MNTEGGKKNPVIGSVIPIRVRLLWTFGLKRPQNRVIESSSRQSPLCMQMHADNWTVTFQANDSVALSKFPE